MNDTKIFVSPNDSQRETTYLVICPDDKFMKHVAVDSNVCAFTKVVQLWVGIKRSRITQLY